MVHLSPSRLSGWCAVAGSALLLIALPLLVLLRPQGLPGIHAPLPQTMTALRGEVLPFWIGEHLVLGAFFLLLGIAVWGASQPLQEWNRLLGGLALLVGAVALLAAALASLWHAVVDPVFVRLYATQDPTARQYLLQMGFQVEKIHSFLRLAGYFSIVWAFLFTVGHLAQRGSPAWWGWMGWALVVAIAVFPPAGLVWSLPAGPILLGKGFSLSPGEGRPAPARRRLRARAHS
ncbi:hypothetical protein HRbin23_01071 [bacterium HR23]|nr:hypothetical protein HRbin23_01071 [bacterium HR23]